MPCFSLFILISCISFRTMKTGNYLVHDLGLLYNLFKFPYCKILLVFNIFLFCRSYRKLLFMSKKNNFGLCPPFSKNGPFVNCLKVIKYVVELLHPKTYFLSNLFCCLSNIAIKCSNIYYVIHHK